MKVVHIFFVPVPEFLSDSFYHCSASVSVPSSPCFTSSSLHHHPSSSPSSSSLIITIIIIIVISIIVIIIIIIITTITITFTISNFPRCPPSGAERHRRPGHLLLQLPLCPPAGRAVRLQPRLLQQSATSCWASSSSAW